MIKTHQTNQKLSIVFITTASIFVFQLIGGIFSNSLALIADSFHVVVDLSSIGIALFALKLSQKPHSSKLTFGFHRAEIVAAFINGIFLVFAAVLILYEAYQRFLQPHKIDPILLLIFASVALSANVLMASILSKESRINLNVKGVYLHILGDLWSLIGVISGALIILFVHLTMVDSIVSVGIAILIIYTGLRLCKKCLHIFMEGTPEEFKFADVSEEIEKLEEVTEVHELHLWVLTSNLYAMSVHVKVRPAYAHKTNDLLKKINHAMSERFGITHCTIQIESDQDLIEPDK
ncbi:MAG TPA: cation diffusion facilitator family transporter [Candidatus Eisenbacteria bacterium]|nr:cation diffusion facilitator family transporter [Candidatus Eisenbacteria bacterium]